MSETDPGHDAQCERSFQGVPSPSNQQWCYCIGRALRRPRADLDVPVRETGGPRLAGPLHVPGESDRRAGAREPAPVRPRATVDLRGLKRQMEAGRAAATLAVRLGYRYPEGVRATMILHQAMLELVDKVSPR
jgi:hypothetical protein